MFENSGGTCYFVDEIILWESLKMNSGIEAKSIRFNFQRFPCQSNNLQEVHSMNETNYDESKIAPYTLPDPLRNTDGTPVKTAFEWMNFRRPFLRKQFQKEMYGQCPPVPEFVSQETVSVKENALDGKAVRKEIRLRFRRPDGREHTALMLLYIPKHAETPVPVFLGLNFKGNPATSNETDVLPSDHYQCDDKQTHRWQYEEVISRGFASATVCYHDFFRDDPDGWSESIYTMFLPKDELKSPNRNYTAIGAWSWGLSRMLDALAAEPLIDATRAAVHGHSRLGKTALLAGALDPRFALVISNDSGCCGAALSRRIYGETIPFITKTFPHWFVQSFAAYGGRENDLPFDQHEFLALIAPRPLAVGSASEDHWADQKGEFLSAVHAGAVYRLFGSEGLGISEFPKVDEFINGESIAYHNRTGKHDQTLADWLHYLAFAEKFLKK